MKTTFTVTAVLMLTFLVGCSEQSPVSGPQSTSAVFTTQLGRPGSDILIDQIVVGATGVKYQVAGGISYKFEMKENEYVLETSVNLKISQSGTEDTWSAAGGKGFASAFNQKWGDAVSEQIGFQFGKFRLPAHYVSIVYGVTPAGVTINNLQILDGSMISTID